MKKYLVLSVIALSLAVAGSASAVTGYGGGSGSSRGGSSFVRPIVTPAVTGGRVLGASTFNFTKVLRQGSNGDAVKELQEKLRAAGYFKYPVSTGYFGSITRDALKAYQRAHGLVPYGIVNRATMAFLNA